MRSITKTTGLGITLIILMGIHISAFNQCIPADSLSCPDPENNGQVCPDTLPAAVTGQLYSQVATIKPPLTIGDSIVLNLHHIQLMDVGNLPDNITWVSNEPNNEFMAGEYYCILLEGAPTITGTYYLKIVVDAYVVVIPGFPPVNVGQTTDSTSLFITVTDPSGIEDDYAQAGDQITIYPNPFTSHTHFSFYSVEAGEACLEVFDALGKLIHKKKYFLRTGENNLLYEGEALETGTYYYFLQSGNNQKRGKFLKIKL